MPSSPTSEELTLPGLRCPNCGRVAHDDGGGRACWSSDENGTVREHCGVMEPVTLRAAVDAPGGLVSREREAFEALLTLAVKDARIEKGGTVIGRLILGDEHQAWALYGAWYAGAQNPRLAREALKDVIRTALIEQTGGTDAD